VERCRRRRVLSKPSACIGCPFYGDGKGFVPDELRENAPVAIYAQNPGADEEYQGKPMVGKTGQSMERTYFPRAGLTREGVSILNTFRCRYNHSNDLPAINLKLTQEALVKCTQAHTKIPSGTKLIVSQGDYASLATTGDPSSTSWRGWMVPYLGSGEYGKHLKTIWTPGENSLPVLVTVHLARLFREPEMVLPTLADWKKVQRYFLGTWPKKLPAINAAQPGVFPSEFAFDTEFVTGGPDEGTMTRYSMSDGQTVWCVEAEDASTPVMPEGKVRVITQNAAADLDHLRHMMGLSVGEVWEKCTFEDTMLAHSVLYSDMPHDLDFLGSLYAPTNRWKHLFKSSPREYSAGDGWNTWWVWRAMVGEFNADPRSKQVYETYVRPLTRIIMRAEQKGIRTYQPRVKVADAQLRNRVELATLQAQAASGWKINLGSNPQVGHHLFEVEGIQPPKRKKK
jgi:uracil-DNA glycosylase family 4